MGQLGTYISYIAGICGGIVVIFEFIIKPLKWSNLKLEKLIQNSINASLDSIKTDLSNIHKDVDEIKELNLKQSKDLEWMNRATLDLLRQEILYLYNHHFEEKKLTMDENTQLHKLYDDYVEGGGNSFVQGLVTIMETWEIIPNGDGEHK